MHCVEISAISITEGFHKEFGVVPSGTDLIFASLYELISAGIVEVCCAEFFGRCKRSQKNGTVRF